MFFKKVKRGNVSSRDKLLRPAFRRVGHKLVAVSSKRRVFRQRFGKRTANFPNHFFKQARKNQEWTLRVPRPLGGCVGRAAEPLEQFRIRSFLEHGMQQALLELVKLRMLGVALPHYFASGASGRFHRPGRCFEARADEKIF